MEFRMDGDGCHLHQHRRSGRIAVMHARIGRARHAMRGGEDNVARDHRARAEARRGRRALEHPPGPRVRAGRDRNAGRAPDRRPGPHRLSIDPAAANARAIAAYAKVGFRPVGVMRRYQRLADGTWVDALLMDLLADAPSADAAQASRNGLVSGPRVDRMGATRGRRFGRQGRREGNRPDGYHTRTTDRTSTTDRDHDPGRSRRAERDRRALRDLSCSASPRRSSDFRGRSSD